MPGPSLDQLRHPVTGESYAALRDRARAMRAAGATVAAIMAGLDVSKPAVCKWVRDLSCHAAVTRANLRTGADRRRLYPHGTGAYALKLRLAGIPQPVRIRLAHEAAR
jgi:hypothetical protein